MTCIIIVLAKSFVAYGQNCVESLTTTKHQTHKFADGSYPLTKVTQFTPMKTTSGRGFSLKLNNTVY